MPEAKIRPPRLLDKTEGRRIATQVGALVDGASDPEAAAYTCARASLMALIYVSGTSRAAEIAYQLADEMADAMGADGAR